MPDQDPAPPVEGITTLEGLRATVREELLVLGDVLAGDATPQLLDAIDARLERLVNVYRGLGGDLELVRRPVELDAALAALNDAGREVAVEDFPERLQPFARAASAVLKAARR